MYDDRKSIFIKTVLLNILPLVFWMLKFLIIWKAPLIKQFLFDVIMLPFFEVASTILAGIVDNIRCKNLKTFNLMGLILTVSAVGGCYLEGSLYYWIISSDFLTKYITVAITELFALIVAVFLFIGNIRIIIRNRKKH